MLNQFYGSGQIYQVISYSEDADCILVPVTERCLLTTVIPIPYDISYDTSRSLGTFYSNISPIVTYANGFSINDPTYKNIEHIIVDGGSTDGTVEMLTRLSEEQPGDFRWDLRTGRWNL